ncbi:hypothetical protein [Aromatoleum anaerobium]|uniref:Uncharacterized protein n=1 Tax=Aromatoleum anaerobium TaxID=182180 RepID=A0ABX1PPN1_9RHOO|nr:hypothetical protein [Aromatoleum anaerobium]MCK0507967.1 hypothetical protein [Aromatoleum anaerobium]
MTNIIYRIQDSDGRGPWKPGFSRLWVEDRDDHDLLIPWYQEFGQVHLRAIVGMHIGCGCRSEDQLRRWFTQTEYARLVEYGYRAVRMPVGRILAESNIQCVFERAKPLRRDVVPFALYECAEVRP